MALSFGPRRGIYVDIKEEMPPEGPLTAAELGRFEAFDLLYRALCVILFNYVPTSGHPGGSISSGRAVAGLLFDAMDYDLSDPDRPDADLVSYAAGHKAMGLYAMWALRDEVAAVADPALLPDRVEQRLRLEDLLGFRRNPITATPLFREFGARALDGHPTPATPFVKLSTGASGVGVASSIGLAIAAADRYGSAAPRVHIMEGEGGLTPGRVSEALAAAGSASLANAIVHLDWNQASIDSDRVCRDGELPGDYVQWDPRELFYLHDWNVVNVPDGHDVQQVVAAQRLALTLSTGQPTAIVYRTTKGWRYGVEGKASHGAGHKLCSEGFYEALAELAGGADDTIEWPVCTDQRCAGVDGPAVREACFWDALQAIRGRLHEDAPLAAAMAARLAACRERLDALGRRPRSGAARTEAVYEIAATCVAAAPAPQATPEELRLEVGASTTLRAELGRALRHLQEASGGGFFVASADLLGSTSVNVVAAGHGCGFWNAQDNLDARLLSIGGICEDAMAGILSGICAYGRHLGVGSSYGAFMAPLGHIAARLHAIGSQARASVTGEPYNPMILVCAHAGLKTGEDGPTHADPQPLQLLQEDFPKGTAISLVPWEPQEVWTLTAAALAKRPAVISAFVTRPTEPVLDRLALGLAPAEAAATGVYRLRDTDSPDVTVVLQESAVTYAFVQEALPILERRGIDALVYYVASAELFDLLSEEERRAILPAARAAEALGITGFTLPTLYRWVTSEAGRAASLHPFRHGHYLGSGQGEAVLAEAGLDGESQAAAVMQYVDSRSARH